MNSSLAHALGVPRSTLLIAARSSSMAYLSVQSMFRRLSPACDPLGPAPCAPAVTGPSEHRSILSNCWAEYWSFDRPMGASIGGFQNARTLTATRVARAISNGVWFGLTSASGSAFAKNGSALMSRMPA